MASSSPRNTCIHAYSKNKKEEKEEEERERRE